MTNFDDQNREGAIVNRIDDAVVPLAEPVSFLAGEFLASHGAGLVGEGLYFRGDPAEVLPGNIFEFPGRRSFDLDAISSHAF